MESLACPECGTQYYSAAAATMVARGELCDCGAPLRLVEREEVPVGAPQRPARNGAGLRVAHRRFARD